MTETTNLEPSIEQRLQRLPRKTAAPFQQLLKASQISQSLLMTILDAGELSGNTNMLIGFATAFLYMRSDGIPVEDAISMAKAQRRRINLLWSPKRWKEEHERLSRAETLRRLAEQDITYAMSPFERHLPPTFAGYLICSSRRLGMEGLRQRHCVASYHDRIQNGACAIATIFVDHTRWTVQLELTGEDDRPISIEQIKGRCNELPTTGVRRKIYNMLGIALPNPASSAATTEYQVPRIYMENLRRILPLFRSLAINNVAVSFDGSGDSGAIEDISYDGQRKPEISQLPVEYLSAEGVHENGRWRTTVVPKTATLAEAIETLTNDYLDETEVDWYNDDGGYGELEIDVVRGVVSLAITTRYISTEYAFDEKRDIATGEEV